MLFIKDVPIINTRTTYFGGKLKTPPRLLLQKKASSGKSKFEFILF